MYMKHVVPEVMGKPLLLRTWPGIGALLQGGNGVDANKMMPR